MNGLVRSDWDEVMLAMDVVDTLRHRKAELDRIIRAEAGDEALVAKVRRIYDEQGIAVSERLIRDAVAALKEERFRYAPPADGWRKRLAHVWIDRGKWGRRSAAALVVAVAVGGGTWKLSEYSTNREAARQTMLLSRATSRLAERRQVLADRSSAVKRALEEDLDFEPHLQSAGQFVLAEARTAVAQADAQLDNLMAVNLRERHNTGQIDLSAGFRWPDSISRPLNAAGLALDQAENAVQRAIALDENGAEFEALASRGQAIAASASARQAVAQAVANVRGVLASDDGTARRSLDRLRHLVDSIAASYEVRIVSRPGVKSGVWRHPDHNAGARNYYLIVEAADATGQILRLPVTSEETGRTELAIRWGVRVDESTYASVRDDKIDDGIIQNSIIGRKEAGHLDAEYQVPTTGGAITRW